MNSLHVMRLLISALQERANLLGNMYDNKKELSREFHINYTNH